ncbi:hypothetical protein VNI00_016796 [Paramarasmius palmivorus]|uniref:Uncharacterized protein n=1 Tax=Paramarasmius palmivorus TaxID=297713 RepID=A0AAW0BBY9_9AGAR
MRTIHYIRLEFRFITAYVGFRSRRDVLEDEIIETLLCTSEQPVNLTHPSFLSTSQHRQGLPTISTHYQSAPYTSYRRGIPRLEQQSLDYRLCMEMPENYPNLTGQENEQPNFEELKPKNVPLAPIYKLALDNLLEIFAASCDKNMLTRERFCPSLALSAIKSLTLRDNTVGESFLTLFPTLEEVVLWDSRYPFHPAQQRTSLSQIRKLKIKTWKTDPDDDFFDPLRALTFPKLSSLHISYLNVMSLDDNSRKPFDEQALTSFLTHSQCFITELVLECAPISDVQTIRLIKLMPTLRSLHIEECPSPNGVPKNMVITSTFLKAISVTTEMAPLAPSLSELTLVLHPSAMGFDCQELVKALSSRRLRISTTVHGLSSANIGFIGPEEANPCIMQQLSTVRAGGKFGGGLNMRIRWVR